MRGRTMNTLSDTEVPRGVVMAMGPVRPFAGTCTVTTLSESMENEEAATVPNSTDETSTKPAPDKDTDCPGAPPVGENAVSRGTGPGPDCQ